MIERGQELRCVEVPSYFDCITVGRRYVASDVKWSHDKQYVVVLGDDNHGHRLPAKLFRKENEPCGS